MTATEEKVRAQLDREVAELDALIERQEAARPALTEAWDVASQADSAYWKAHEKDDPALVEATERALKVLFGCLDALHAARRKRDQLVDEAEFERRMEREGRFDNLRERKAEEREAVEAAAGLTAEVRSAIVGAVMEMHAEGTSYSAIARALNQKGVPTLRGGHSWYPATVRTLIKKEVAA